MIRYTARNGTTFQFDPDRRELHVLGTEGADAVELDFEDVREFLQYVDDRADAVSEEDAPSDADVTACAAD